MLGQLELWVWSEDGKTPYGSTRHGTTETQSNRF